jgi:hypothetical protein
VLNQTDLTELEVIKICYSLASLLYILSGMLHVKRGQYSDAFTQIGLGIMVFVVGLAQILVFDY